MFLYADVFICGYFRPANQILQPWEDSSLGLANPLWYSRRPNAQESRNSFVPEMMSMIRDCITL